MKAGDVGTPGASAEAVMTAIKTSGSKGHFLFHSGFWLKDLYEAAIQPDMLSDEFVYMSYNYNSRIYGSPSVGGDDHRPCQGG
jgi:hypothetical protein